MADTGLKGVLKGVLLDRVPRYRGLIVHPARADHQVLGRYSILNDFHVLLRGFLFIDAARSQAKQGGLVERRCPSTP